MSVQLSGSGQWLHRASAPSGSADWTVLLWLRRDTDNGANQAIVNISAGGFTTQSYLRIFTNDVAEFIRVFATSGGVVTATTGVWRAFRFVWQADTGGSNGVLSCSYLAAGTTTWSTPVNITGLTNVAPDQISIGGEYAAGGSPMPGTYAFVKIWSGVRLSDADALTEIAYREAQTNLANLWATYKFASGALTTDSSGNARTLTAAGTPTYVADEPADILGDNPSGGGGTTYTQDVDAAVNATGSVSDVLTLPRSVSSTVNATASREEAVTYGHSVSAAANASGSVSKAVSKFVSAAAQAAASVSRSVSKNITATVNATAAQYQANDYFVNAVATAFATASSIEGQFFAQVVSALTNVSASAARRFIEGPSGEIKRTAGRALALFGALIARRF